MEKQKPPPSCCLTPRLQERTLFSPMVAGQLSGLFKVLSNDTRLRILHELLRKEEACVSDLSTALGMSQQAISNQLQRLADWRILSSRRDGNSIFYRLVNPCVHDLLDRALCFIENEPWSRLPQLDEKGLCQ